jgi:hypothetical protein
MTQSVLSRVARNVIPIPSDPALKATSLPPQISFVKVDYFF